MNNLFVDVLSNNTKFKTNLFDKLLIKTFGFILKEDKLLKENNNSTFFLLVNTDDFRKSKRANKVLEKILKRNVSDSINVIFSKAFDSISDIKISIKKSIININNEINYIEGSNKLKDLDKMYISRYILENKIDINRFKLLIVLDNIFDFDTDKLIEYVEEYKFVDILRMSNISKSDYKKLNKIVEEINNEYGSSIEIIQKRNIQDYHFYMLYTSDKKEFLKSHYILNKNAYILDITNMDDDILSKEYKSYKKNKGYVETIFNRMNLNMESYSKIDIGMLYIKS